MFKIIGIVFLAGAGIMWLRQLWANSKNKSISRDLASGLKNGAISFSSMSDTLDMMVRTKKINVETPLDLQKICALDDRSILLGKFTVSHVSMRDDQNACIVIAQAKISDTIPLYETNKEVDLIYPCWLYIEMDASNHLIYFKSQMPHDKEHGYLLQDLSDYLYELSQGNSQENRHE